MFQARTTLKSCPNVGYRLVDAAPVTMEHGVIYVSQRYHTAAHLCACGRGLEIVTPLGPDNWSFAIDPRRQDIASPSGTGRSHAGRTTLSAEATCCGLATSLLKCCRCAAR